MITGQIFNAVFIFNKYGMPLFGAANVTVQDALNGYAAKWSEQGDSAFLANAIAYIQAI